MTGRGSAPFRGGPVFVPMGWGAVNPFGIFRRFPDREARIGYLRRVRRGGGPHRPMRFLRGGPEGRRRLRRAPEPPCLQGGFRCPFRDRHAEDLGSVAEIVRGRWPDGRCREGGASRHRLRAPIPGRTPLRFGWHPSRCKPHGPTAAILIMGFCGVFMGGEYAIQAVGCDIPNAAWWCWRVTDAHRCRMGGPGVTVDTRCAGSVLRRIPCRPPLLLHRHPMHIPIMWVAGGGRGH